MGKRVLVAVIFIPLLLAAIYGVSPVWPIILPIIIAALSMIAVHEALWSTSFLKHPRISGYSILLAGLIPFWVYYDGRPLPALCGLFVYVLLLFCEAIASRKRITLEKMGGAFFLSVFIPFFLSSFLRIRLMGNWEALVVLPFIVAFISDAFALFAGMAFGRHKLAPELSPKKTVEGAVGGVLGTMVFGVLVTVIYSIAADRMEEFTRSNIGVSMYVIIALLACVAAVLGIYGDLFASVVKRQCGIKDYGTIFPGHRGILDRFDSVMFIAPFVTMVVIAVFYH